MRRPFVRLLVRGLTIAVANVRKNRTGGRSEGKDLLDNDPGASAQVRLIRVEMAERRRNAIEQFLGLRGIAAFVLEAFDAQLEFADAIFSVRNPLGDLQYVSSSSSLCRSQRPASRPRRVS